jgi:hypothetical protein
VTTGGQVSVCSIPLGDRSDRVLDSFPYLIRANIRFDREFDRNEHLIGPDFRSERTTDRIKHPIRLRIESEWKFVWTRNSIGSDIRSE